MNLKADLYNSVDLQLVVENYVYEQVRAYGVTARKSGFGDLTTRLKVNLWGNDGGTTAFAVMPFVKFPTNTAGLGNKQVEGGIIFPLAVRFPECARNDIQPIRELLIPAPSGRPYPACARPCPRRPSANQPGNGPAPRRH